MSCTWLGTPICGSVFDLLRRTLDLNLYSQTPCRLLRAGLAGRQILRVGAEKHICTVETTPLWAR